MSLVKRLPKRLLDTFDNCPGKNLLCNQTDVARQRAVGFDERHRLAHLIFQHSDRQRSLHWRMQVQCLARTDQFNRENVSGVLNDRHCLPSANRSHAHVVFY